MARWPLFCRTSLFAPVFQGIAFRALRQGAARRSSRKARRELSLGRGDECEARLLLAAITVDDSGGADYTTITAAVNNAAAGDVITVNNGTYNETVSLQSIAAGGTLTIQAANPQQAFWNDHGMALIASSISGNFVISGFDLGNVLIDDVSGVITLHDNRFDDVSTADGISGYVSGPIDTGLHIIDNDFDNFSQYDAIVALAATSAGGSLDVVVDGNSFTGLRSEGLRLEGTNQLTGGTLTARVTDNVFGNRAGFGTDIFVESGGPNSNGYFSSILIDNNRTNLGSVPTGEGDALWVDFNGTNTTQHVTVSNNNFNHNLSGINLDADLDQDGGLFNSRIEDNTLANIADEGIHLSPFSEAGGSRSVWNSVVAGNTLTNINSSLIFNQPGIEVEVDTPVYDDYTINLDILGNNVSMAAGSTSSPFLVDANSTNNATVNIERDIASNNTGAVNIDDPGMIVTMPSANAVTDSNEVRTISGFVFNDSNRDGSQVGEAGVGGVPVTLTGTQAVGGSVNLTTYTDINGNYSFPSVVQPNGAGYMLTVGTTPELGVYTLQDAVADAIDSDVNPANGLESVSFFGAGPAIDVDAGLTAAPEVNLSVSANSGTEAGTTAITVTATADFAVSGHQTVDLAVTGPGITAGDFTLSTTTITILNGQTTGNATFTIVDDGTLELTEVATLTISNPSAGISLGGTDSQDITIADNIPATLVVDTIVDENDGDYSAGDLSLREAIILANMLNDANTITFAAALDGTPIVLSINGALEQAAATGDLDITSEVTIDGQGQDITIDGGSDRATGGMNDGISDRVLHVLNGGTLTLEGITVRGGFADAGAGLTVDSGGTATLNRSRVVDNSSSLGGGIAVDGDLTVQESSVSGNVSPDDGGGMFIGASGTAEISSSTISGNSATDFGGGIVNIGNLSVVNTTISGNQARDGSAIASGGTSDLANSTVYLNEASNGSASLARLSGTFTLNNTIVSGSVGGDLSGDFIGSHNLIEDGQNLNSLTNTVTGSANLGPLQDNGGPTPTHALLAGSPAINAGNDALALDADSNPLTTDQRGAGFDRFVGTVDIGAFEFDDRPDNVIDVFMDGTELVMEVNSVEVYRQVPPNGTSLQLGGGGGRTIINIDHSGGVVDVPISVEGHFQSGTPDDVLNVLGGSFTNVTYDFTNATQGTINYDGAVVTYSGLEAINDTAPAVNRTFEYNAADETIQLSDNLVDSDGEMIIDSTLGKTITFAAPTSTLRIDSTTGSGADEIEVLVIDSAFAGNLTIVGDSDSGEEDNVTIESSALSLGAGSLDVAANQIALGNDIATTSGNQTFTGAVQLTGDVQLTSTMGSITFAGTVDADLESNARTLAIDSGSGAVEFQQTIGGSEALGSLSVNSTAGTGAITVGNIGTSMDAGITGETRLGNNTETGSLLLEGSRYYTSGNQIYKAGVGQEILIDAEAPVSVVGDNVAIAFSRTVRLGDGSNLAVNTGLGGAIDLLSGVRGTSNETVDLSVNVIQLGDVGSGDEILSLTTAGTILDLRGNIVTSSTESGNFVALDSVFTQLQLGGNDITIDSSAGHGDISIGSIQGGKRNLTLNAGFGDIVAGGRWGLPDHELHTVSVMARDLTLHGGISTAARGEAGTDTPGDINLNVNMIHFTADPKFSTTADTGGNVADGTLTVGQSIFNAGGLTTTFDVGTTDLVLSSPASDFDTLVVTANTADIVETNGVTIDSATIGASTGTGLELLTWGNLHIQGAVTTAGSDVNLTTYLPFTTPAGANAFAISGGNVTLNGDVAPGARLGDLVVDGDVTFTADEFFLADIEGPTPATGHDQVRVTGANRTVALNGVRLYASIGGSYEPADGVKIVLIDNVEASSTVTGTFAGFAEGDVGLINGYAFFVSYADGTDGNDVTLTMTSSPTLSNQNFNAAENQTAVGTVVATDLDLPNDMVTFSLTGGGADAGRFSITAGGVLTFNNAPDYETLADANTDNVYEVEVQASDSYGNSTTATMFVTVTDVNEAATLSVTNVTSTIPENVNNASRVFVEDLSVFDVDAGVQQNDLSLTGADAGLFEVVGNQVFLIANAGLSASSNPHLDVQLVLDDPTLGAGPEAIVDISVIVTDPEASPLPALGSSFLGMTNGNWWLGRPDANGDYDTAIAVQASFNPNNIVQSFQGDFTGDGLEDTAILLTNGELFVGAATQNGEFVFSHWTTLRTYGIKTLHVGDFNADGMADIVGAFESGTRARLWVFESTGSQFLPDEYRLYNNYAGIQTTLVGNFDGINGDDLAIMNDAGVWWVAKSDIAGTEFRYGEAWEQWDASRTITNLNVGDFNGDDVDDILGVFDIPLDPNRESVVVGLSSGSGFDSEVWRKVPLVGSLDAFVVGDFDGDDNDDFALLDSSGNWRTGLVDSTNERFIDADWGMASIGGSISTISVGDTNADGIADILVRNDTSRWQSAESTGSSFNTRVIEQWSSSATWHSVQVGSFAAPQATGADDVAETEEVFGDERILDLLYGS